MPSGASVPVTRVSNRRIGVLGGTFDPIHLGHLVVASEVHAALALDTVMIVPTLQQPFKGESAATPQQRLDMCRLAVMDDDRLEVSDVDIARGTETFTVDTLVDLHAQLPDAELFFIAGADALARLDEWRDASRLKELARFVGVARPGHGEPRSDATHVVVETPEVGVSSTVVRRRAATGAPLRYLVPDRVAEYIVEHGLYLGGLDG
jgi:nicotinate-nucleotide adenylyltransferase